MEKGIAMELTKIKKIVADIREFPAKIDSAELAKKARQLLKKYALLSQKIERNVLIGVAHQKDLAKIRTAEFKEARRALKEKANSILHAKNSKNVKTEKPAKTPVKKPAAKKDSKAVGAKSAKEKEPKKTVKKTSAKSEKASAPKKDA